ncbi:MAG: endolytic transglycosylase MltG [Ruminococcus sp.]|nr:endolytic transglycosylase MltG [Ruminococcus sp.]
MGNNYNSEEKRINELRKKKIQNFHLDIDQDDLAVGERYRELEHIEDEYSEDINSYSGEEAREQMRRDSRNYLREEKRERKKQMKYIDRQNKRRFRLIWWVSVLLVGIMLGIFLLVGVNDMMGLSRPDEKKVTVSIPENPTFKDVCNALKSKGVIKEEFFFDLYATFTKNRDSFTQGTYEMKTNMDYEAIINYLQSMQNRTDTIKVTITEGMNVVEIAKKLVKKDVLPDTKEFLELCNSDYFDADYSFIKSIKNPKKRYYKLEGYLFPDTYECYHNENPKLTITRMLNDFETRIYTDQNVEGYAKAQNIRKLVKESKYTFNEILTLASIIQAEAANSEDMYYISSILHNRLTYDASYGVRKLGLDSTKYYPYRSKKAVPASKRATFKSKYSTYDFEGLPPGPICNPGTEAILAAIYPEETDYLYFCHDKKGKPYYASNLWQHNYNLSLIEG